MSADPAPFDVAYVMSVFPAVTHTFLHEEVAGLRGAGARITTFSVNRGQPAPELAELASTTTVLKDIPKRSYATAFVRYVIRHPTILRVLRRRGSSDPQLLARRAAYLAEACQIVDALRATPTRHLHAHFGGPCSTVAWFAAEVGNIVQPRGRPWTWSLTVHGWSEFVNENENLLSEKIAAARFVVAISSYTRAQLWRIARPRDWDKIHVVRCGIDLAKFPRRPPGLAMTTAPRVCVVARLSAEKGHLVMVEALGLLRRAGITATADIVGPDSPMRAMMEDLAARRGVSEQLVFHGALSPADVADVLGRADLFCLPTFAEGLPIVIMEAMARGVPVVTTYISGIPELARNGETALVVPAGDPEALAAAIRRLVEDPDLVQRLTDHAVAEVRSNYDIRCNVSALMDLFVDRLAEDVPDGQTTGSPARLGAPAAGAPT